MESRSKMKWYSIRKHNSQWNTSTSTGLWPILSSCECTDWSIIWWIFPCRVVDYLWKPAAKDKSYFSSILWKWYWDLQLKVVSFIRYHWYKIWLIERNLSAEPYSKQNPFNEACKTLGKTCSSWLRLRVTWADWCRSCVSVVFFLDGASLSLLGHQLCRRCLSTSSNPAHSCHVFCGKSIVLQRGTV